MSAENLKIFSSPNLKNPVMLMGFSGWMNGGEVSTGTIECFVEGLDVRTFAEIESKNYYIYNFPGPMEVTSLFRPHCVVEDGLVKEFNEPVNVFWASEKADLILFMGQEPNINWVDYSSCVFSLCNRFNVGQIYFLGSVASLVPHTREPRYLCSVSDALMKGRFEKLGFKFTNYNGPASIANYLITCASGKNISMASIIAEIPAYVHGRNPKCIGSMARMMSGLLGLGLEFSELIALGEELEKKLTEIIANRPELSSHIEKLEADYDNEVFDTEMVDLKDWLHKQGIRLD